MHVSGKFLLHVLVPGLIALSLSSCGSVTALQQLAPVQQPLNQLSYDWLQFGGNANHSGFNAQERVVNQQNIVSLRQLFQVYLPEKVASSTVYLSQVNTPRGLKNLLFLTTTSGSLLALDAENGDFIWMRKFGASNCQVTNSLQNCYTNSIPAIDPSRQYIYSYGLDGKIHKLQVTDGTEITRSGWPVRVVPDPSAQTILGSLTIASPSNGSANLYVVIDAYPESKGNPQNAIATINLSDATARVQSQPGLIPTSEVLVDQNSGSPYSSGASGNLVALLPASSTAQSTSLGLLLDKSNHLQLVDLGSSAADLKTLSQPVAIPQGGSVESQPAVWMDPVDQSTWIFISNSYGLSALKVSQDTAGKQTLTTVWSVDEGGTSPQIVGNVLYYASAGVIRAVNPYNGKVLWSDTSVGQIRQNSPILVGGVLYITDWDNHLTAYSSQGLLP